MACAKGCTDFVRELLDHNADINRIADDGETPLSAACEKGQEDVVRLLLERGAMFTQPGAKLPEPSTPAIAALLDEFVGAHEECGWFDACEGGDVDRIRSLLDGGVDADQQFCFRGEETGMKPLLFVSGSGKVEAVRLLLDRGADVNHTTRGITALHCASSRAEVETTRLLLERGADIELPGTSPLDRSSPAIAALLDEFESKRAAERRAARRAARAEKKLARRLCCGCGKQFDLASPPLRVCAAAGFRATAPETASARTGTRADSPRDPKALDL
eukprot:CAMPEP_0119266010 /NCGR_PEP_ID=MMETSP1329-20130426/4639_1 /TAXON_ID=114041 /ORGANISM="Genus nov. species nov., Strain RCC1024" /LENGTH=274 /DNA_ID=CAMNT_0007265871 /DNA_START=12 /DNA_END=834 /DNA_ORIENTATION=+